MMQITGLVFLAVVALAVFINFRLPLLLRKYWLLALSILFCFTWSIPFGLILLAMSGLLSGLGILIERSLKFRKGWLWIGIGVFIASILVFKYLHFFTTDLNRFIQKIIQVPFLSSISLFVPVGLSFLALQAIAYLVDVYHQRIPASRDWVKVTLYLLYFPKLLSGPIERPGNFFKQVDATVALDPQKVDQSVSLIIMGLVRKVLLANPLLGMIPADTFSNPGNLKGTFLLGYLFIYSWGLYNDFAGYTNIARGVSGLFGIDLLKNFDFPFASRNLTEFWQRWHISLSRWLRDYIYFPTSRWMLKRDANHQHVQNIFIPPLTTMLISGLWHGFAWNTLLWGGLFGLFIALERLVVLKNQGKEKVESKAQHCFSVVLTFILVTLLWMPFKMQIPVIWQFLKSAFSYSNLIQPFVTFGTIWQNTLPNLEYWAQKLLTLSIPLYLVITILFDWLLFKNQDELGARRLPVLAQSALFGLVLLGLFLFSFSTGQPIFIYQNF